MAGSMGSKKTTRGLDAELAWWKKRLDEITLQTDTMWKEIQAWPVEEMTAYGRTFKGRRVVNLQLDRTYDDLMREKGRIEYEISKLESWLFPRMGRTKGKRNEHTKPADPSFVAAAEYRKTCDGKKATHMKLAQTFSQGKNLSDWKKWIYNFKKYLTKARRPSSAQQEKIN